MSAMIRVVDEHAPFTIIFAATIMAGGALLVFGAWYLRIARRGVVSLGTAQHTALLVAAVLVVAWAVARLNGPAYLLAICGTFLGSFGAIRNMVWVAATRASREPFQMTAADWLSSAVMMIAFFLLLTPSSLKAQWGFMKGFSR